MTCSLGAVCYHKNGLSCIIDLPKHGQKRSCCSGIQGSCRFVCQNNPWICDQSPRYCRPLLLSAGNLIGIFLQDLCNAKSLCNRPDLLLHFTVILPCQHQWKINIVSEAERIQKVKILEYKSQIISPESGNLLFR